MKLWLILSFTTKFSSSIVNKDSFLPKVLPSIQTGNFGLGFEAALSLGTSAPISLHVIHFLYLSYRGRATSCTQVSFYSRPQLIIESYELYISTSEPTSARNNNEVSRVVWVDEQLTHCSLSSAWYETAMMESKVVYCLQKYSWKEPVNGTPDNFSRNFSGIFPGATECLKTFFLFFRSCFFSSKPPLIPV